jgi:hypothetical protein
MYVEVVEKVVISCQTSDLAKHLCGKIVVNMKFRPVSC